MILDRLRGELIVSVQPEASSVLNTPQTVALLCRCAVANGAAGLRVEGSERIAAVRRAVGVPLIGLVKRAYPGFAPYITPTAREIGEVVAAGAEIVAFDATGRPGPSGLDVAATVAAIRRRGALAMADCATAFQMRSAAAAGADLVATTLCGFTEDTRGHPLPAVDLVRALAGSSAFVVLEGGVGEAAQARAGILAGADAVVVGTALTDVDRRVRAFATEVRAGKPAAS